MPEEHLLPIVRTANETIPISAAPTPEFTTTPMESVGTKPIEEAAIRAVNAALADVFFPYDRSELRSDALSALARDSDLLLTLLAEFPRVKIIVEGHCDERGSAEYNLGLGDGRAVRAADFLCDHGVPRASLQIVSYGKERPQCDEPTESCRQRNRRVHLTVSGAGPATASRE